MDEALRNLIRNRANFCCEYCSLPEEANPYLTFHIEHVIARRHVVNDSPDNLALACDHSSIDPETMTIVYCRTPKLRTVGSSPIRPGRPSVSRLRQCPDRACPDRAPLWRLNWTLEDLPKAKDLRVLRC